MMQTIPLLFALAAGVAAPNVSSSVLRLTDVTDLTGARELAAEAASLPTGGADALAALAALDDRADEVAARGAALVEAVRTLTAPPLDADEQAVSLLADSRLAVLASPKQHEWIEGMLSGLRAHADALVDVQTTVFELPAGTLAALPHPVAHGDLLGDDGAAQMLRELAQRGASAVTSPHLVTLPARRASIAVVQKIPFVQDYASHAIGKESLLVPTLGTVEDGVRMDVCAAPTVAGAIVLSVTVDVSDVELRTYDTTLGGSAEKPVTFQLPEILDAHGGGRFELPSGGHGLIAFGLDAEREVAVLIRAALTTAPGGERR